MTFYARILELHPEYEGMRAADLAAQGMACPAERSAELLGNDGAFCEMENKTPGRCMKCQMNFLTAEVPGCERAGAGWRSHDREAGNRTGWFRAAGAIDNCGHTVQYWNERICE